MEHLSEQQHIQVRTAVRQLNSMPVDRRRAIVHSVRELRPLPPDRRAPALNSPAYRKQFSDQERDTLNNLMQAQPYIPR